MTAAEGYYDIGAIGFQKGNKTTLIIHNASPETKYVSLSGILSGRLPDTIGSAVVSPTADYSSTAPSVNALPVANQIQIPVHSVTRIVWE